MSEKKVKKEKAKLEATITPVEIDEDSTLLRGKCLSYVFKDYLPYVSKAYTVKNSVFKTEATETVSSFDITKFVIEKDDNIIDKLKNVYHLLAYSNDSVALILTRTHEECRISLAVGTAGHTSGYSKKTAQNIRDALLGNFPGTECSDVVSYNDSYSTKGAFAFLNEKQNFSENNYCSAGVVSNIASDISDNFSTQGIEKLIDSIHPKEGQDYTLIIIGKSLSGEELREKKEELYNLYTAMSPFSKRNKNWGSQEGKSWSKNWNVGLFANAGLGEELIDMIPAIKAIPVIGQLSGGINASHGHSKSDNIGVSTGESIEINQYDITHTLEIVEKQTERLEQCEALGLWNVSAYVFSHNHNLVNEVAHMYMSLTQGQESYYEKPSVNTWNAQDTNVEVREFNRNEIFKLKNYISHLNHPAFIRTYDDSERFVNDDNWPHEITCTSSVSGLELAKAMNLPAKSVPGVPVIECAPFGREISSYNKQQTGNVNLGMIHHMHKDEELPVALNADSLTSHVFVTGSTGSGKSNTVYKLLSEANRNFLVIEPAKGEYKYVFGNNVNKFGTNYMMGNILQINPFSFPDGIHVFEHIDRLLEVFNVCWPMYAAMPAILKDSIIKAYEKVGWNLESSWNVNGEIFPTFSQVCEEIDNVLESSDYSDENKGNYRGSLKTRLQSLTNGINGTIFCQKDIPSKVLFDEKTIIDLSRVGSSETKSLIMGILVIKLQEYRMCRPVSEMNEGLKHITVLEEAHNLLKNTVSCGNAETGGGMAAKSVEMIANAIAEMRTYGEGFVIVDQSPGLLDMSAIRNTNTKIIMRLPEQSDRELVGRSANLNDGQIIELAKLQKGVAAVYQNEWIEPVLCHIGKYEYTPCIGKNNNPEQLNEKELEFLNSCIYDPNFLIKKSSIDSFIDCVDRLDTKENFRAMLKRYALADCEERARLYPEIVFSHFKVNNYLESTELTQDFKKWSRGLMKYIKENFQFVNGTNLESWYDTKYLFVQSILERYLNILKFKNDEEKIDSLSVYLNDIKSTRIM